VELKGYPLYKYSIDAAIEIMSHLYQESDYGNVPLMLEMGAYEWLWQQSKGEIKPTFKNLADFFRNHPNRLPSELVPTESAKASAIEVLHRLSKRGVGSFGVRVGGMSEFPEALGDADNPIQFLYFRGNWNLIHSPIRIAIVGTRQPSPEGVRRAAKLARLLADKDITVVSGLAKGIDKVAHEAAIKKGGNTVAVIGTPIDQSYPRENKELQELIAREHLLISQVPVLEYAKRTPELNRFFFPERNITMSALTHGTVIVEAGDYSGTLILANAALKQGRKLFILNSNFLYKNLKWPHQLEERGAIRVKEFENILECFDANTATKN